ncbi:isochorismatase family protein [Mesorhizobium sp. ASY16-5R]|uniref:isochorismatase family protein n=1 Tax=Mesorhizobium sp. ASY16-5R TaxID=3445772 RepID=UPI003F9F5AEE
MLCVPATVLAAIDHGFRTVIVTDAICSSADQTHDGAFSLALQRASGDRGNERSS